VLPRAINIRLWGSALFHVGTRASWQWVEMHLAAVRALLLLLLLLLLLFLLY
jgi:hypothetical protein